MLSRHSLSSDSEKHTPTAESRIGTRHTGILLVRIDKFVDTLDPGCGYAAGSAEGGHDRPVAKIEGIL
jgi:hypothetical protein